VTDPTSVPDTDELDSLLGAYALDALEPADRARVDDYLARSAAARAEVDEMRETAAALALLPDTPTEAPPELWARISETIASERAQAGPAGHNGPADELATRRSKRALWIAPVAVAAAIAIVLLAVQVASLHSQLNRAHRIGPSAMAAAFDNATKVDGARSVGLESKSGTTLARLVLLPDGTGYLRGDHLRPLASDRTYQLWALTGPKDAPVAVSAGVLGTNPAAVAFHASGPVHGFAVTVEHAGGAVQPQHRPIASGTLS
jgi:anti-sigma-K factor RskA